MNIYLISQSVNQEYDTYDAAIVAAKDSESASYMHPGFGGNETWTDAKNVTVQLIGTTDQEAGVILASFNAG